MDGWTGHVKKLLKKCINILHRNWDEHYYASCKYARAAATPHKMLYLWLHDRIGPSAIVVGTAIRPHPHLPSSSSSGMKNLDGWMMRRMDGKLHDVL
jgi:hypothetical protein